MLSREDIQNIFQMYIDGVSIEEINKIYQKKSDKFCEEKELDKEYMPPFDIAYLLSNFKVLNKYIVTQEAFDFVQRLLKKDEALM